MVGMGYGRMAVSCVMFLWVLRRSDGFTSFRWVLRRSDGFYVVPMGFTSFRWVLRRSDGRYFWWICYVPIDATFWCVTWQWLLRSAGCYVSMGVTFQWVLRSSCGRYVCAMDNVLSFHRNLIKQFILNSQFVTVQVCLLAKCIDIGQVKLIRKQYCTRSLIFHIIFCLCIGIGHRYKINHRYFSLTGPCVA